MAARQIQQQYPVDDPLVVGEPDGIVRPARMLCHAAGCRIGTEVFVTGSLVDASVGRLFELMEGDVTFIEDEGRDDVEVLSFAGARTEGPESAFDFDRPKPMRHPTAAENMRRPEALPPAVEALAAGLAPEPRQPGRRPVVADTGIEPVAAKVIEAPAVRARAAADKARTRARPVPPRAEA